MSAHRFLFSGLFSLLFAISTGHATAAERVAMVIGVDRYDNLGPKGQLSAAVSDAKLMSETLQKVQPSFTVIEAIDASREELSLKVDEFVTRAMGAECALVYFAGHGIEFHGSNYLVPRDGALETSGEDVRRTKERLHYSLLPMQKLLDDLHDTGAGLKLLIVDACRENPFSIDAVGATRSLLSSAGGLGRVTAPGGTLISYSADAGEMANDGVFTSILTRNIALPEIELMEVFARTRVEVRAISSQLSEQGRGVYHEPAEYSKLDPGALSFAFNRKAPETRIDLFSQSREKWLEILNTVKTPDPPTPIVAPTGQTAEKVAPGQKEYGDIEMKAVFSELMADAARSANHPFKEGENQTISGIEMVFCRDRLMLPFMMGSGPDEVGRTEDERFSMAKLTAFWIGKYELSQAQWLEVMDENPSKVQDMDLPVHNISLMQALQWCARMNERVGADAKWAWAVPTEAQWEYACSAGSTTPFAFGNSIDGTQANFNSRFPYGTEVKMTEKARVMPSGSYPPNQWGIADMHGNLAEVCFDIFGEERPTDGGVNPVGPMHPSLIDGRMSLRVVKGGDFLSKGDRLRSAARSQNFSHYPGLRSGFRPVMVYRDSEASD